MKLWQPKRIAANSQARKPLTAFALTLPAVVGVFLASTYSSHSSSQQQALTFNRDIAPIFYKHCAARHQPEDIAPFSVLDYEDVLPWKNSIREKVAAREMPPWHADPRYGDFANVARLSQPEIDTIVNWVRQGAKQGDPKDLPELPKEITDFQIGKPDYILAMTQEYTVQPHSPDQYVYVTFLDPPKIIVDCYTVDGKYKWRSCAGKFNSPFTFNIPWNV